MGSNLTKGSCDICFLSLLGSETVGERNRDNNLDDDDEKIPMGPPCSRWKRMGTFQGRKTAFLVLTSTLLLVWMWLFWERPPFLLRSGPTPEQRKNLETGTSCNLNTAGIGQLPGSIDVVITWVNFSRPVPMSIDHSSHRCDPRSIVGDTGNAPHVGCDRLGPAPCCHRRFGLASKSAKKGEWGTCTADEQCSCQDCFDYRFRGAAQSFEEIRFILRSFEKYGLHVQSTSHPEGILGRIFIVYNDEIGNGAPAWLKEQRRTTDTDRLPGVIAVPHSQIWPDPSQLPSSNRNAIVANLHRIPGLGKWFLYLEDDIFLNRPFDMSQFITNDGRIRSHLSRGFWSWEMAPKYHDSMSGYEGAGLTAIKLEEGRFGPRPHGSPAMYAEGLHCPKFLNTCVLSEITRLWSDVYAETVKRRYQAAQDSSILVHHAMYLEDLGLGVNDPSKPASFTKLVHTHIATNGVDMTVAEFLCTLCNNRAQWLQIQGYGISDEYVSERGIVRGDLARTWWQYLAAKFPVPSIYEDETHYLRNDPGRHGMYQISRDDMCAEVCPTSFSRAVLIVDSFLQRNGFWVALLFVCSVVCCATIKRKKQ